MPDMAIASQRPPRDDESTLTVEVCRRQLLEQVVADDPAGWLEAAFEHVEGRSVEVRGMARTAFERLVTVGARPLAEPVLPGTVWRRDAA